MYPPEFAFNEFLSKVLFETVAYPNFKIGTDFGDIINSLANFLEFPQMTFSIMKVVQV